MDVKAHTMADIHVLLTQKAIADNLLGIMYAKTGEEAKECWENALRITDNFHRNAGFVPEKSHEEVLFEEAEKLPHLIEAMKKWGIIKIH